MATTTCGRRLERGLPGHLQGSEGTEWKNLYYKFVEMIKEDIGPPSKWQQQGRDFVEGWRRQGKRRRVVRQGQHREAVRQELWKSGDSRS